MVLNLYSCALRGVDVIYALCAFNEPILVDERVWCGGGCGFGEGWHGCDTCERTGAPPLLVGGCPGPLTRVTTVPSLSKTTPTTTPDTLVD